MTTFMSQFLDDNIIWKMLQLPLNSLICMYFMFLVRLYLMITKYKQIQFRSNSIDTLCYT